MDRVYLLSDQNYSLLAHLGRRAGFGATLSELEEYVAKGYEAVAEDLLKMIASSRERQLA